MKHSKSILFVVVTTLLMLALIEVTSNLILRARGTPVPMFLSISTGLKPVSEHSDKFSTLDPHLGYAHGRDESLVKENLKAGQTWVDGFVVYAADAARLQPPVILALGGSTTDGLNYGHSWPEELAGLLHASGVSGTVVNGGTAGYSTNQELLKLIRDGSEFKPDIVISYSGVNDRGTYGELPHPMVHRYQRQMVEALVHKSQPPFMPSSVGLLQSLLGTREDSTLGYTYGVKSSLTLGQQYRRNIELMNAVARAQGAIFFAFIQPNAFYHSRHASKLANPKGDRFVNAVLPLYEEISPLPATLPFARDATGIFEEHEDVYKEDGVHVTPKGDKIVAEYIFGQIRPDLVKRGAAR